MFRSKIYHKTRQAPRKAIDTLVANTTLSGNLFKKFMTQLWNILASRIYS